MAERRMFTKKITDSDAFLDMPTSTQNLYFHYNMAADDDGFVNSPKQIQRKCRATDDDATLLVAKSFVIQFESGIIVIKHWKMHNYIQSDRYHPTDYTDEKSLLYLQPNKTYSFEKPNKKISCIQNVYIGKDRLGKVRLDKVRLGKVRLDKTKLEKYKIFKISFQTKNIKNYFNNKNVNNLFIDFLTLRIKLKAINSDLAIKCLVNKLNNYSDEEKITMINNSIVNSWKDVFPIKSSKPKSKWDK